MYQIIIETMVNDYRYADSIYTKIYSKKAFAERKAQKLAEDFINGSDHHIVKKAYVRKMITPVTEEEAKAAYCRCKYVYIDGEYGQVMLKPSGWYGSHAPASELFYRSVHASASQYDYNGNFYVQVD